MLMKTAEQARSSNGPLHVSLMRTLAGDVELRASKRHRLRLHASAPIRGECQHQPFLYTHGDLDLIPSGMSDTWRQDSDSDALSLEVDAVLLERAADALGQRRSVLSLASRHQFRDSAIEHVLRGLYAAEQDDTPSSTLYRESLGLALAARLWRSASTQPPAQRGLSKPVEQRLLAYIDEHLHEELSLFQLAEVAGCGASQLKLLFKRSLGYAVHDYVIRRRVERARGLVTESDRSLAQIALELGFAHQSHLARCMRRVLGVTPGALRRAHQR